MTNKCLTLALHGGAGAIPERNYDAEVVHMRGLVEAARDRLTHRAGFRHSRVRDRSRGL